jgi:hypothetical protein
VVFSRYSQLKSLTNKIDTTEILLKVALNTITITLQFENKECRAEIKLTD